MYPKLKAIVTLLYFIFLSRLLVVLLTLIPCTVPVASVNWLSFVKYWVSISLTKQSGTQMLAREGEDWVFLFTHFPTTCSYLPQTPTTRKPAVSSPCGPHGHHLITRKTGGPQNCRPSCCFIAEMRTHHYSILHDSLRKYIRQWMYSACRGSLQLGCTFRMTFAGSEGEGKGRKPLSNWT